MLARASNASRQARHPIVGRNIVDPRNIIRAGIAASVALHLSFLTLALLFSEVRPFGPVVAENVAVDVVTPDQVPDKTPEPTTAPQPQNPAFDLSTKPALDNPTSGSSPEASSPSSSPQPSQASPSSASQPSAAQPAAAAPRAPHPTPPRPTGPRGRPQPPSLPQRRCKLRHSRSSRRP